MLVHNQINIFLINSNIRSCWFYCSVDLIHVLFGCVKLIGYIASAANVVSSNPCVGPSTRIKIPFPLSSICTDQFISAPKAMNFSPMFPSVNKNTERESNPMP